MKLNNSEFSILSPTIMGICNVTKDSFSDGGKNFKTSDALKYIKQMLNDGAQIIDIGAESTRPGSDPITYKDEIKKLSPILKKLPKDQFIISIDSSKIETQEFALENGAQYVTIRDRIIAIHILNARRIGQIHASHHRACDNGVLLGT